MNSNYRAAYRLTAFDGDGARAEVVAPLWSLKKFELLNAIDREMTRRGSFQGMRT